MDLSIASIFSFALGTIVVPILLAPFGQFLIEFCAERGWYKGPSAKVRRWLAPITKHLPSSPWKRRMLGAIIVMYATAATLVASATYFALKLRPDAAETKSADLLPPSFPQPPSDEEQRRILVAQRSAKEDRVRDAGGTAISLPLKGVMNKLTLENGKTVQFSASGPMDVWIYPDGVSHLYVRKVSNTGDWLDIRKMHEARSAESMDIGSQAVVEFGDGSFAQIILVGVQYYNAGDPHDQVWFKYKLMPKGNFSFQAL